MTGESGSTFHSPAFELFVDSSPDRVDLSGMVAYSIYKQQKCEWIAQLKAQGRQPSTADEQGFAQTLNDSYVNMIKVTADSYLSDYANFILDGERDKIKKETLEGVVIQRISEGFGWIRGIGQGILVNIVSIPIIFILTIAFIAGGDVKKIINGFDAFLIALRSN